MSDQKHTYTLHYFNLRARGEPIRLIFIYFDVQFEDNRISQENWPKFKPDSPMGQAPYLVVDDGKLALCQMQAICRYIAKSLRPDDYFAGATKSDSARCDMYVEAFMDLYALGVERAYERDPEMKAKKDDKFKTQCPVRLEILQDHLKKNGGQCFVGKKVLWCDLVALCVLSMLVEGQPDVMSGFPDLHSYYLRMRSLPEIKDYVEEAWPPAATVSSSNTEVEAA